MTNSSQHGIFVQDLNVRYANGHTALHDVNFHIPAGTVTGLVGVNGAGKSTLFKALMGILPVQKGNIRLMGHTIKQAQQENLVSYVPQAEDVDWSFPILVRDVVMMGRYGHMGFMRRPKSADVVAVNQALTRLGMVDFADRQIGQLSGGQRKRVFLARALAQESQIILLDEPFTGVDVTTERIIMKLMHELRDEGRVLLVSTHNLGSVTEMCDHTILVKQSILAFGPTAESFTKENLEHAFGGVLRRFTLSGQSLHEDEDARGITILSDDERPFVQYGDDVKRGGR